MRALEIAVLIDTLLNEDHRSNDEPSITGFDRTSTVADDGSFRIFVNGGKTRFRVEVTKERE